MGSFLREGVSGLNPESDVPIPVDLLAVLKTMLPDMISKVDLQVWQSLLY